MADALLVFSPLQEISFFVSRSPYFDQIGVTPLLRRRLFGLQSSCFSLSSHCIFSLLVFQVRLLALSSTLCLLLFLPCGNLYNSLAFFFTLIFRLRLVFLPSFQQSVAPYLPLSLCLYAFLIRKNVRKTSSAVAYSALLFIFTKN